MKKLTPLLILLFLACDKDVQPKVFYSKTMEVIPESPTRDLDQRIRLNAAGHLDVKTPVGWTPLPTKGLPVEKIWPNLDTPEPVPLSGYSEGPGLYLGTFTPRGAFLSADRGLTWTKILQKETLGGGAYLTAMAIDPLDPKHILVGTSFNGLFETRDQGKTWIGLISHYWTQSLGADYWEQVHSLAFSPASSQEVYVSLGIKGEVYSLDLLKKKMLPLTTLPEGTVIQSLGPVTIGEQENLEVRTQTAYWRWNRVLGEWSKLGDRPQRSPWELKKATRMAQSANKHGIYVSANQAAIPSLLEGHLKMMKDHGLNALVVDFKDDTGVLVYDSKVDMAIKADAVRIRLQVPELVAKIHEAGFYLIARVVVFKDEKLYKFNQNKYALWDNSTKKPWGFFKEYTHEETGAVSYVQKEFWVDIYSQDVWDYNIAIAKELQELGIDEIQFDYIRFPSDGPTSRIVNRFAIPGMTRVNALESFLKKARSEISSPISVDIFGFNGFFPMEYLGQNSPMIARYADAISPMFYPSHFSQDFFGKTPFLDRARKIYEEGALRSNLMNNQNVHVRPWIQSFLLGDERQFSDPDIKTYLRKQLEGSQAGGGNGWLLWNAANNYYMVREDLSSFKNGPE